MRGWFVQRSHSVFLIKKKVWAGVIKLKKLNGFQRIWVVLSILLVIPTSWLMIEGFPGNEDADIDFVQSLMKIRYNQINLENEYEIQAIAIGYKGFDETNLIAKFNSLTKSDFFVGAPSPDFDPESSFDQTLFNVAYNDYKSDLRDLKNDRIVFIFVMIFAWVIVCILIYLFGFSIFWIKEGFKDKD